MTPNSHLLNLLIVEDDHTLAASLKLLASNNFRVFIAQKPSLIPDHIFFHIALIDMHLESLPSDSADGLEVVQQLIKKNPQLEIVAISGKLDRYLMEKAVLAGAQRFLAKPLSADEVTAILEKTEALWRLRLATHDNHKKTTRFIGTSDISEKLRKRIAELKSEKSPILIEGETGVGKDVVARLLNEQEENLPFITVNCSALTDSLFESEFFGHLKGSFTGADYNKIGFAEAANGGDLFLDEIEAMPLQQQAKLLRFLESGEIRKVGSKEAQHVEVRVIVASNVPLKQLVAEKKFREDLYFRLSAHRIEIPALRDRKDDIPEIAKSFIEAEKPKRNKAFDEPAIAELQKYRWPGNVRELKRVCEQLVLTSPLPIIRDIDVKKHIGLEAPTGHQSTILMNVSLDEFLKKQEKSFIENCLHETQDIDKALDVLKISKSSLYKKIKDLGIQYE